MRTIVFALVFLTVLAGAAPADAVPLSYDFDWFSLATYSTLVPVNRVEPDGTVVPFEPVTISKTQTGNGTLRLTPLAGSGYFFEFAGAGGSGSGHADQDGTIAPGGISFPVPADVPIVGSRPHVGGRLELAGDPRSPSALSIAYYDLASPHCMMDCSAVEFHGTGRLVSASEPSIGWLFVLAAGAAATAGIVSRRARRRQPD